ncbi:DUF2167 domain-containing protein [Ferrimonas marina]|uniref:Uncharacterized membrane-anchored protein n=1 Tax=Ferrimonas marina TaxID=299255 RepID=A0A1M5X8I2_9GAMM|nr:DUF2167 domain-containing protein [Ferrimonas marina]SHH96091.1 Uncharacterized membrane-anchored protein [Ferrimonas marina]
MRTLLSLAPWALWAFLAPTQAMPAWPELQQELTQALEDPEYSAEDHGFFRDYLAQLNSLAPQQGQIPLAEQRIVLNVPEHLYYFSPEDAELILSQLWQNVPGTGLNSHGLLMPVAFDPMADASWATTLHYVEDGYIDDSEAQTIDYDALLSEMQADTRQESMQRAEQGYPAISLVGWASAPYYDGETHKLHWAQELHFVGYEENTLNYDIRVLGRQGFLQMGFIAHMSQLEQIQGQMEEILAVAEFSPGHQYSDFDASTDKMAAYGIGGLIAGKTLAKTGVLAAILMLLKKFWFVALAAIWGLFKGIGRLLGGNKAD